MNHSNILESDVIGSIGTQKYLCKIVWRNGTLLMDEPLNKGGNDFGPDPFTTLLSSLAGCTLTTLRMYIDRKGWDISEISVQLNIYQEMKDELITTIKRDIFFSNDVSTEQKEKLLSISKKCPISKILENKIAIDTKI